MSEDDDRGQFDFSRRKLLGSVATLGAGSLSQSEVDNLADGVEEVSAELEATDADVELGVISFGNGSVDEEISLGPVPSGGVSIPTQDPDGNTPMPGALDIADDILQNQGRSGAEKIIILFTDGGPNYSPTATYSAAGEGPVGPYDQGSANGLVDVNEMDQTWGVADAIKDGGTRIATIFANDNDTDSMTSGAIDKYGTLTTYLASGAVDTSLGDPSLGSPGGVASTSAFAFQVDAPGEIAGLAEDLVALIAVAETVFFVGTLRQTLQLISSGAGFELIGDMPAADGGGTGRNCFSESTTHYIGFEWWLPINHGNQVQGDSVSFDIGFYTEQCRHNDGSGMANS